MLETPNCHKRNCAHYLGVKQSDGTEMSEVNYCLAYPEGIPDEIAYDDNLHLEVREDQDNNIVYEEAE